MRIDNQTGLALITSMVFLLILSIIGISAMQDSTLEQAMSSNVQDQNHAFQLAESGIVAALSDTDDPPVFDIQKTGEPGSGFVEKQYDMDPNNPGTRMAKVKTHYPGESTARGETFREINTIGLVTVHNFHIDSQSRRNNAVARHARGVTIIAPKSQ